MDFANIVEKPLKPAEYAENQLLKAILESKFTPGQSLPAERALALSLGVTRPTLRETLQRLSREGWVTIQHGKPTIVNDYLFQGGLGILSTLAKYGQSLPNEMVSSLLQARSIMFPGIALQAVKNDPESILAYLEKAKTLADEPDDYVAFDWGLQMLMIKAVNNPVFVLMFNDFTLLYEIFGEIYFQKKEARDFSCTYYKKLINVIGLEEEKITDLVKKTMEYTQKIWQENNENI